MPAKDGIHDLRSAVSVDRTSGATLAQRATLIGCRPAGQALIVAKQAGFISTGISRIVAAIRSQRMEGDVTEQTEGLRDHGQSPRRRLGVLLSCMVSSGFMIVVGTSAHAGDPLPEWAYPMVDSGTKAPPPDGSPQHVPGSPITFRSDELRNFFFAPDWHPEDHPPIPEIVATGRKPAVSACGFCHRAEGPGGPENATLAGLPADYILQQLADYKSGARTTAVPERLPQAGMIALSKALTDQDAREAALYFASIRHTPNVKVIETHSVPKTRMTPGWFMAPDEEGGEELLGARIIEVPVDVQQHERRDSRTQFIAYVPVGSIAKGASLVATGAGRTLPCGGCHGADFRGIGAVPPLAGRFPGYTARQLHDMQHGARAGAAMLPMKPVVANLTSDDILNIAAYLAAQTP